MFIGLYFDFAFINRMSDGAKFSGEVLLITLKVVKELTR